jgi:ferritin-like metal-binding protein YciE
MPNTKSKKTTGQSKSGTSNGRGKTKNSNGNGSSTAELQNLKLEKFFEDSLKDIYWAEKQLMKALPKMRKAATTKELQDAIDNHTAQTEDQAARLEKVFDILGKKAQAKKCDGMEGLIAEGEKVIEETDEASMTRDVGIIVSAQKVEHYEIAAYGSLVQLAITMGQDEIADILNEILQEEKDTDELLTEIAESNINWEAELEGEGSEE